MTANVTATAIASRDRARARQTLAPLLTLLATPVAYSLFDDLSGWLLRRRVALTERGLDGGRGTDALGQERA